MRQEQNRYNFLIRTLVDITSTGERTDPSTRNFNTLVNGLGLHFQPFHSRNPWPETIDVTGIFGPDHTGEHPVWQFPFWVEESSNVVLVEVAKRSLNHMPVIMPDIAEFITDESDPACNMRFQQVILPAPVAE